MTEVESYAHPMPFRDEQPPVASVEVKDTESPVLRVVVGEEHAVYSTRLNFRYTVGQPGDSFDEPNLDRQTSAPTAENLLVFRMDEPQSNPACVQAIRESRPARVQTGVR